MNEYFNPDYKNGDASSESKIDRMDECVNDNNSNGQPDEEILERMSENTEMLFSDEKDDIIEGLDWFSDMLQVYPIALDESILKRSLDLLYDDEKEISLSAQYLLFRIVRTNKNDPQFLLDNGILDYISSDFPTRPTIKLLIALINATETTIAMLLDADFAEQIINILKDDDNKDFFADVGDICSALVHINIEQRMPEFTPQILAIFTQLTTTYVQQPFEEEFAITVSEAFSFFVESSSVFLNFFLEHDILSKILFSPTDDPKFVENILHILSTIARSSEEGCRYIDDKKGLDFAEHYMDTPNSYVSATAIHVLSECLFFLPELSGLYLHRRIIQKCVDLFRKNQMLDISSIH